MAVGARTSLPARERVREGGGRQTNRHNADIMKTAKQTDANIDRLEETKAV